MTDADAGRQEVGRHRQTTRGAKQTHTNRVAGRHVQIQIAHIDTYFTVTCRNVHEHAIHSHSRAAHSRQADNYDYFLYSESQGMLEPFIHDMNMGDKHVHIKRHG